MTLKLPSIITKDWVKQNCRCAHKENRLLCQESCEVHTSHDVPENRRDAIEEATRELGWRLDWHQDQISAGKKA